MDVTMLANDLTSVDRSVRSLPAPYGRAIGRGGRAPPRRGRLDAGQGALGQAGGRLQERPAAVETVQEAAEAPDDTDVRAALAVQLRRILAADAALAEEVRRLLAGWPAEPGGTTVAAASGERSIAVGRDAIQSVFRTGDEVADSD